MNKQEIFETVAKHLFTQGKRAMMAGGENGVPHLVCVYRGKDGVKCAVGCLIPDELYRPGMEYLGINLLISSPSYVVPDYFDANRELLQALQYVHDNEEHWETTVDMRSALQDVGVENGLDTVFLNDLSFSDR